MWIQTPLDQSGEHFLPFEEFYDTAVNVIIGHHVDMVAINANVLVKA